MLVSWRGFRVAQDGIFGLMGLLYSVGGGGRLLRVLSTATYTERECVQIKGIQKQREESRMKNQVHKKDHDKKTKESKDK